MRTRYRQKKAGCDSLDTALHHLPGTGRERFLKLLELVFYPSFCRLCSRLLDKPGERLICEACWDLLRPAEDPYCLCCGRFFELGGVPHVCPSCLESPPAFRCHRSLYHYRGAAKEAILLFKYKGLRILGRDLGRRLYEGLKHDEALWWGASGLIPVPLHPRRKRTRGFNQSEILGRELAERAGLPLLRKLLRKDRAGSPQTSLSGRERRGNLIGAFSVKDRMGTAGRTWILVDDVFTTGTTLKECSRVLIDAGAREVRAVTLAQA